MSGQSVDVGSIPGRFGSPFSSRIVVSEHCHVTLSLTINETLKWLSNAAQLNAKHRSGGD